ncbi:MAG: transglutaminase-like domain-containing protein [Thermoplasmatota archaeon]
MRPALALASVALLLGAGCTSLVGKIQGDCDGSISDIHVGPDAWNRDGTFLFQSAHGKTVTIQATSAAGQALSASGTPQANLTLPDGTWSVAYSVAGTTCQTLSPIRVDSVPPSLHGLVLDATAPVNGTVTVGSGVVVEADATIVVRDPDTGVAVGTSLPLTVGPLTDGVHLYEVTATDPAGNAATETVQVRVGSAAELPQGAFTFGVVGRYTNQVRLWDISNPGAYMGRAAAQAAMPGYLGAGLAIVPSDPTVQSIVAQTVTPDMNTEQAALALFHWMAGHLQYDFSRLGANTLMTPDEVINDHEDPGDHDSNNTGIVDTGRGNGVKGGVCRDLAATYVSLLRAAGVPARLVSGYLGGTVNKVNGFHAWVQFYGGSVEGADPWVVVDVSPVNGHDSTDLALQSFAIQATDYLALRDIPPSGEVKGWSTALDVNYTYPHGSPEPQITFETNVTPEHQDVGVMCFNPSTLARKLVTTQDECGSGYNLFLPNMVLRSERLIDYGVKVHSAPSGSSVTAEVAYPLLDAVAPNGVTFAFYGPAHTTDNGKAIATFDPTSWLCRAC